MAQILKKAAKYKRLSSIGIEGEAHLIDPYSPAPILLKPTARSEKTPDDVTNFPLIKSIPIPESIPYAEGKYRPASIPIQSGYFPYNMYLTKGKVYNWCACGCAINSPWCDGHCNHLPSRLRPVTFNVDETGYYKICQCKQSANAPFCNGTHLDILKYHHKTHRGSFEIWGYVLYMLGNVYMIWNWYT